MRYAKLSERNRAFTIVEVMMAVVVMLAGVIGMIQALTSGAEMIDFSRKQTIATQIIHSELDNLHLSNWTAVSALPASATITINSSLQTVSQGFTCTRTVESPKTNMKKITFRVDWKGSTGHAYHLSNWTYFGKNGLYVTYQRS
jgi:type IV pilus assembly protein PilV